MSEWATRRQPQAAHQEATIQVRTQARRASWDADEWLDYICLVVVVFSLTWLILDVATCLNAYEALGPRMAAEFNPQCA